MWSVRIEFRFYQFSDFEAAYGFAKFWHGGLQFMPVKKNTGQHVHIESRKSFIDMLSICDIWIGRVN